MIHLIYDSQCREQTYILYDDSSMEISHEWEPTPSLSLLDMAEDTDPITDDPLGWAYMYKIIAEFPDAEGYKAWRIANPELFI